MTPRPHYETLGVKPEATQDEIKRSFRAKAKTCHPDHHPGDKEKEAWFKRLSEAYAVLSDPDTRRHYDETGEAPKGQENILGEAYSLIVQTFQRLRDAEGDNIFFGDPLKRMQDMFTEGMSDAKGHIKKLQEKNKRNEKLTRKISHKNGGSAFLHAALADENRRNEVEIGKTGLSIEIMKKAVAVLEEYSFAAEKREVNVRDKRSGFPFDIEIDPGFNPYAQYKPFMPWGKAKS